MLKSLPINGFSYQLNLQILCTAFKVKFDKQGELPKYVVILINKRISCCGINLQCRQHFEAAVGNILILTNTVLLLYAERKKKAPKSPQELLLICSAS